MVWREELEKVNQYYFLAMYYHGVDKQRYEKYMHHYNEHLKQYVDSYERGGAHQFPLSGRFRRSRIRLLHASLSHEKQQLDVYIDGKLKATVSYLTPNPHLPISAGTHKISIYLAKQKTKPLIEQEVAITRGNRYLLAIADKIPEAGIQVLRYQEAEKVKDKKAKLRFIHLSPELPALDLADPKHNISFLHVRYQQSTSYETTDPGRITVNVLLAGGAHNRIANISFEAKEHQVYTLLTAGRANNPYWMLLLDR